MALKGATYTARPKRSSDGAVNARYKKKTQGSQAEETLSQRLISDKLTAKKPADEQKAAKKTKSSAASKAAPQRPAAKKAPAHRAVMATPQQAQRAKKDKAREPGRVRRERLRRDAAMRDRRRAVSRGVDTKVVLIALLTAVFVTGGLLLAAVRSEGTIDTQALSLIALMAPLGLLTSLALPRVLPIDPLIMALTNFLCGVGVVVLYTVSPARGVRQASYYVLGLVAMIAVSALVSRKKRFRGLTLLAMVLGVAALILPLAFGEWAGGAKNWVSLPLLGSFQPSELVKLSLVLAMAYYFSAHRTVLQMMPAILFAGACLLLLMLQRDLGTALIYYATTLAMFYVACGNVPLTIVGLGGGVGAAVLGYKMFAHVKVRVAMWRNPWSDPLDKGYQIIQALLAIGSGGLFGVGLGQGTPEKIPAYYNDFIFAVICEQLGLVFGVLLLAVYV
ncbi:MAG: FtsW/RodA/SpoVE family cell cycle protein, partial [Candidatus Ventricola sp.]